MTASERLFFFFFFAISAATLLQNLLPVVKPPCGTGGCHEKRAHAVDYLFMG